MGTLKRQVKQWYANNTPEVLLLYTVLLHIHYAESKTMHTDGLEDIPSTWLSYVAMYIQEDHQPTEGGLMVRQAGGVVG